MSEGRTSKDREQELRDEYMRLWEARDASEGHQVLSRSLSLTNSLDVFRGNHAELKRFLNHVATPSVMAHMWAEAHRYRLDYAKREAARLLHNYIAAAFSLVDSTRRFVERHYAGMRLLEEYEARVKKDFAEAPLHRFLQRLRNHTLHHRLPPTKAVTKFKRLNDGEMEFDNGFWLNVARMREWGDWSGKAREYLESLGEEAKLDDIIDAYEPVVVGFHRWLSARIWEEHADAIEETFELERRMKVADLQAYGDRMDTGLTELSESEDPERGLILDSLVGPAGRADRDVFATPDDVVVSLYESLSFPHGGLPNLDRFRSLFLPNAQLIEVEHDGTYLTHIDSYVSRYHRALNEGTITAVSKHETARRSNPVGDVAHVLSFHETRYVENREKKCRLDMYDIHMVKAGDRWVITGMHLCVGYGARLERSPRTQTAPEAGLG